MLVTTYLLRLRIFDGVDKRIELISHILRRNARRRTFEVLETRPIKIVRYDGGDAYCTKGQPEPPLHGVRVRSTNSPS